MKNNSVVFIAFQERENLGIGYMYAVLSEAGYEVSIIDFRKGKEEVLRELLELNPMLVGFSVIFENHIYEFQELIQYLRGEGIQSHFTAGGHFASLRPGDLFELIPSLDSIVRFEGEHTLLDLVNHLHRGEDWKAVQGISYKSSGNLEDNPLRALEPDLDAFPIPFRPGIEKYGLDKKFATLLAGRGCVYHCAFCDIREFYGPPPGPVKRIRKPEKVAEEMEYLYKEHDCSVFLFQDDDFPVRSHRNLNWVEDFCQSLRDKHLTGKILWKINCRPDEVDPEIFKLMREHGLFKVYLGIEDGTDDGLLRMNKRIKAADNLQGVQELKRLGIIIDYGFMLFQPSSTFHSINENLAFLEQICSDGYMPVTFLKMMPYLATKVEKDLRREGRLKGRPGFLDYDFLDRSMDDFYAFVDACFNTWLYDVEGLNNNLKWARNYLSVFTFFYGSLSETEHLSDILTTRASEANRFVTDTMLQLSALFESGKHALKKDAVFNGYLSSIAEKHKALLGDITWIIKKIEIISLTREVIDWK
jgi:anaerobic magnesium-protoporphyrin IX monomethyl ester cyclase